MLELFIKVMEKAREEYPHGAWRISRYQEIIDAAKERATLEDVIGWLAYMKNNAPGVNSKNLYRDVWTVAKGMRNL